MGGKQSKSTITVCLLHGYIVTYVNIGSLLEILVHNPGTIWTSKISGTRLHPRLMESESQRMGVEPGVWVCTSAPVILWLCQR